MHVRRIPNSQTERVKRSTPFVGQKKWGHNNGGTVYGDIFNVKKS
jgi:hypothetical protein